VRGRAGVVAEQQQGSEDQRVDEGGADVGCAGGVRAAEAFGGGLTGTRSMSSLMDDDDEELGPVAKALLEALKESGNEDLLPHEGDADDEEDGDKK